MYQDFQQPYFLPSLPLHCPAKPTPLSKKLDLPKIFFALPKRPKTKKLLYTELEPQDDLKNDDFNDEELSTHHEDITFRVIKQGVEERNNKLRSRKNSFCSSLAKEEVCEASFKEKRALMSPQRLDQKLDVKAEVVLPQIPSKKEFSITKAFKRVEINRSLDLSLKSKLFSRGHDNSNGNSQKLGRTNVNTEKPAYNIFKNTVKEIMNENNPCLLSEKTNFMNIFHKRSLSTPSIRSNESFNGRVLIEKETNGPIPSFYIPKESESKARGMSIPKSIDLCTESVQRLSPGLKQSMRLAALQFSRVSSSTQLPTLPSLHGG